VELPHRNRSVFKHARINKQEEKEESRSISHGMTQTNTEKGRSKEFLPQRRQVRKERKTMSDAS